MVDYDVERFLQPQEEDYVQALSEIRAGHKYSHWIWYIFPQLKALGRSYYANFYGISGMEEAKAYLAHPTLRKRLIEISQALLELKTSNPKIVMGAPDNKKLCSSMTLFALANPEEKTFRQVLEKFYGGEMDQKTIELLKDE